MTLRSARPILGLLLVLAVSIPAGSAAARLPATLSVVRRGIGATTSLRFASSGEAIVDLTVSAPGVSWGTVGSESAVVSLFVDGRYQSDLVVMSEQPTARSFSLGSLAAGTHTLTARFADDRSPAGATSATLVVDAVRMATDSDPGYVALAHAPVLYGRQLSKSTPFANATTDTPLLAWHESAVAPTPGDTVLEYSVVWSNEDGGTDPPALMARWGRTTDIEWIYRVEVDASGTTVPGTAVFQGANHTTKPFGGTYEGDHPLLETCTSNNNVCDTKVNDPMRFALDVEDTRVPSRARESLMDTNPWTYTVMAQEMLREGQVESPSDPATPAMGDQRTYLFVEIKKQTDGANDGNSWVGVAVGVRLLGDPNLYRSDHLAADWAIRRDLPAATTVELPAGTTAADITQVVAIRTISGKKDTGATVTASAINRGFFLDPSYLPEASFLSWAGSVTLTPTSPSAVLVQG
ncbi:MAG: Ig-like domain-containing protein [Actinomycetota bacterium]